MRRLPFVFVLPITALALLSGCAEKEAENPGDVLRSDMTTVEPTRPHARAEMFSHAEPQSVRAACDANGNLHLTTPPGSRVIRPDDATFPSEAIVALPDQQRGKPIRVTRSLGYIGDNKLGESQRVASPYIPPREPTSFYPYGY